MKHYEWLCFIETIIKQWNGTLVEEQGRQKAKSLLIMIATKATNAEDIFVASLDGFANYYILPIKWGQLCKEAMKLENKPHTWNIAYLAKVLPLMPERGESAEQEET